MRRTEIQKAIIPRNWLFGRLSGICRNLKNVTQADCLTPNEFEKLAEAWGIISSVLDNKKESSNQIKAFIEANKIHNGKNIK